MLFIQIYLNHPMCMHAYMIDNRTVAGLKNKSPPKNFFRNIQQTKPTFIFVVFEIESAALQGVVVHILIILISNYHTLETIIK